MREARQTTRILLASLVGTSVEFYDFYIYATATSLVFGPLFFPASSASAQLLSSYASFGLAFLARPLGGALFGHFGDRIGRKSTLVASLLLMGISTAAIAFLPTYAMVGWLAPALLCLLRFGQGIGLGGEWSGAALLAVENAPPGWRARYGMMPQLGAPVGFLAANGFFLLLGLGLSPDQFRDWGWRIPFLASALLVGLGLWVRLKLTETAAFAAAIEEEAPPRVPIMEVLRSRFGPVVAATLGVVACFALYYIATAFTLGYGTTQLGYPRQSFLEAQLGAILFMAAGILFAGWLSDRLLDPRRVLIWGCLGTIAAGALLAPLVGSGQIGGVFLFLALALLTMGFVYGPLGAWLPGLFPPQVRYTGTSLAFNVGGIIGGGLTPAIAQVLAEHGGLTSVGVYLAGAAVLSLIGLLLASRFTFSAEALAQPGL
ncbi:MFS transporter [Sphingomonas oligoaromativorans]|uniref:MFS transporter n=1 Tax=Sphingomonas oligoaromativorans TaxID=575322 RepID=UPI0014213987|nr:MFS transporter [Sphingomonas oligoaromativorans]NIJ32315.1 MFS family permease [Sphingomonas oligoaromativorans]